MTKHNLTFTQGSTNI